MIIYYHSLFYFMILISDRLLCFSLPRERFCLAEIPSRASEISLFLYLILQSDAADDIT